MVGPQCALGIRIHPNSFLQRAHVTRASAAWPLFDEEVEAGIAKPAAGRPHSEAAVRARFGAHDHDRASVWQREDDLYAGAGIPGNLTHRIAAGVQRAP